MAPSQGAGADGMGLAGDNAESPGSTTRMALRQRMWEQRGCHVVSYQAVAAASTNSSDTATRTRRTTAMANSPEEKAHWRQVHGAFDHYMRYHVGTACARGGLC
jgi:hypothetical protein